MNRDIDESSENVLSEWSRRVAGEDAHGDDERDDDERDDEAAFEAELDAGPDASLDFSEQHPTEPEEPAENEAWGAVRVAPPAPVEVEPATSTEVSDAVVAEPARGPLVEPLGEPEIEPDIEDDAAPEPVVAEAAEHAAGELGIPDGYAVLEGEATGGRRAVGVVVSRFNGDVTTRLLERALAELEELGVERDAITVLVVPGAFELPLAATALAKTRRFACVVALGCVIRGETPHFEYVAGEAASGLQLAALETGVPVSFGVLTLESPEQADARIEKGAEAVRTALEMADVFAHLRAAASR